MWRNRDFVLAGTARFIAAVGYGAIIVAVLLQLQSSIAGREGVWAVAVSMAASMALPGFSLPVLFALTVVLEAALAVASPTWQALLPRIVGEDRTPRAVGSMQATLMLAQLAGPAA
ncbi:hypothetical protein [Specibacter cremeus]|uniref:hypothetical protein n=1 Tax=Specibacter cremeus TaxID=1629051 RepID=UPI000F77BB31|nr:hypothetical protein [Specibacter cremeus]